MNRELIIVGLIMASVSTSLSNDLFHKAQSIKKETMTIEQDIMHLKAQAASLSGLENIPVKEFNEAYEHIYTRFKIMEAFYDFKVSIEVPDLPPSTPVVFVAKPSPWEGIQQVAVKVRFDDVRSVDKYVHILENLSQLQRVDQFNVVSMEQNGKKMELFINLYGK
jgi:hypothetical protein